MSSGKDHAPRAGNLSSPVATPSHLDLADATATTSVESNGLSAVMSRFAFQVVEGPDKGATLLSESDRVTIGQHDSAEIVLSDKEVGRFHCEVRVEEHKVVLRDLGGPGGTRVDDVPVVKAYLRLGSIIELGRTRLEFRIGREPVRIPLPDTESFGGLVGRSLPMRLTFAALARAARSNSTVLLEGETGTGKDVGACSIHEHSDRAEGPFVVVDCASLPPELMTSELFGHEAGSFTGSRGAREGAFRAAKGGTIFLDEVGELPLELQPKLLRALERREVKAVGADTPTKIDVRVIAATNRDLRSEVNAGRFRADLFYRLAVIQVRMPPLRDRPEDIPILVESFLGDHDERAEFIRRPEFLAHLRTHTWPGNVRELRNYVNRCATIQEQLDMLPEDEPTSDAAGGAPHLDTTLPLREARERWMGALERTYLESLLGAHQGNVSKAARAAGVDRAYFYRLLWRYGLK